MKLKDLVKLKPIIEAIEQGETIQRYVCTRWVDIECFGESEIIAFISNDDYGRWRIKPEPREVYVALDLGTGIIQGCFNSSIKANEWFGHRCEIKKFREVIE